MKRVLLAFVCLAAGSAYANPLENLSMGLSTGTRDGLSVGYEVSPSLMYQSKLAMEETSTDMSADMLFMLPEVTRSFALVPYYGIGMNYARLHDKEVIEVGGDELSLSTGERQAIGVRVPVGLLMRIRNLPLQVGMEAAAHVGAYPRSKTTMDTAMNIRLVL